MQKSRLFEYDPETEITFHKLKRQRALLTASTMAGGEEAQRQAFRDYVTSGARSQTLGITIPPVAANNFEFKPALISMV